ncbi:DUF453 domain protein [Myriangium duriaei CBS 260.36]|uniref:DUF453 domain protein n=1 Tax=Myriangium duriaei CBS 260.36 TaxID=1168546 RepID=A0A9P4MG77_9PEZI|nr:DUF453 domain protein [Myriangium duriaei CBS 260.36]
MFLIPTRPLVRWRPLVGFYSHFPSLRQYSTKSSFVQRKCPASYYRGGTSRAVIFERKHLPENRLQWDDIFRAVIGSPDPNNGRQLDGFGGGISSLSKVCVVEPATDPSVDVDYTFAALGVRTDEVDYSSNCGNMSSAIGPFAVDNGLIKADQGQMECTVRIRNTNTGKVIHATFPLDGHGNVAVDGDFSIDGVAGTAPMIKLAFVDPAGSKTGKMLPTGSIVDRFDGISASCVDVGNPCVFVSADALGVPGDLTPDAIDAHPTLLRQLDSIRRQAGSKMGLAASPEQIPGSIPKIAMVSKPHTGATSDVVVRALSVGQPHRAVPITVALAVAAAAQIPGSTVHTACVSKTETGAGINIAHASGTLMVTADVDLDKGTVAEASVFRTARLLMKGEVYWKGHQE